MDPVYLVIVLLVVIAGVWGSMILAAVLRRLSPPREGEPDPRIEELQVDYRQLEARLEQLEEEASFLRELRGPEPPAELPAPKHDVAGE